MKYVNSNQFADALEIELQKKSAGSDILLTDVRNDIALERLASRFDPDTVAVKGGFAVRTLLNPTPFTQDLDILINKPEWRELSKEQAYKQVSRYVIESITETGEDHFRFTQTMQAQFTDLRPDQSIARIWAEVAVGDKSYGKVIIDAGVMKEDVQLQKVTGRDVLAFANIDNPTISITAQEYLAADKVSLFLERGTNGNRPRDIVHAGLLLEAGRCDDNALANWLDKLSKLRGVEDQLLQPLQDPPREWLDTIDQICDRYALKITAQTCYERINDGLDRWSALQTRFL